MKSQHISDIKSMMESLYGVAENLDERGISYKAPFRDPEGGIKGIVQMDMLLSLIRCTNQESAVNRDCLNYINECLGYNFTRLTFEIAKKKASESEIPDMCLALPLFLAVDKQLGGNKLSFIYIQALAYVMLGYIQCEDKNTLEEMVAYYRLCDRCIKLAEKALKIKVDFDPLARIKGDNIELIKCAIEVDKVIHEKDPIADALEKTVIKMFEDLPDADVSEAVEKEIELYKETGDGSDLEDEMSSDIETTAMDELNALIGLQDVKQQVNTMVNVLKVRKRCAELNVKRPAIALHMVFTGNPGTGKTTVARILGKVYKEAGLLSKGHFIEASRAELVDKYVGHTAIRVKETFEKAKGGILFIDEAYALTSEGDSFGQEAVETLLKLMEDNRDDIAVIVAGYPALMQDFLESNPGLKSRFPFVIEFPDYSGDELTHIFKCFCKENDITAPREVVKAVNAHFNHEASKKCRNYGNARAVRNYFEKMIMNQSNRLIRDNAMSRDDVCKFTMEDLPQSIKIKPMQLPEQHKFSVVKGGN